MHVRASAVAGPSASWMSIHCLASLSQSFFGHQDRAQVRSRAVCASILSFKAFFARLCSSPAPGWSSVAFRSNASVMRVILRRRCTALESALVRQVSNAFANSSWTLSNSSAIGVTVFMPSLSPGFKFPLVRARCLAYVVFACRCVSGAMRVEGPRYQCAHNGDAEVKH